MTAIPKPVREKSADYLAFVRSKPCLVRACPANAEPHHVTRKGQGKVGSKESDSRSVPLCRFHHEVFHSLGTGEFESRFGMILEYEIIKLNRAYRQPKKQKREKKVGILRIEVSCRCVQKTHSLPPSKVLMADGGLSWSCPVLKERIEIAG